jgi:hypothetical protein
MFISSFRNKYDLFSNIIAKGIFNNIVKNKVSFSKKIPEFNCKICAIIKKVNSKYIKDLNGFEYKRFGISLQNTGNFYGNNVCESVISINIYLSKSFSSEDFESLNYALYEGIRHELEHINTFKIDGKPDDEYGILSKNVFESIPSNSPDKLLAHCNLISEYFLHPQEISSYAKSIYFISKKKRQDFRDTIEDIFNRTFFNNDLDNIRIGKEDKRILNVVKKTKNGLIESINRNFPNSKIIMKSLPY